MEVRLAQGSLTEGDETLWVNASNTNLQLGSGVSGAIRRACGTGFQAALDELLERRGGPLEPGDVIITGAGAARRARYIAHVAVMDYRAGVAASSFPTIDRVRAGCEKLWEQLDALPEDVSVAMVALGAGTGGLGLVDTVEVACRTLQAAAPTRVTRITFYGFALHEHVAMASVVCRFFPEAAKSLTDEVRDFMKRGTAT
jgi:O-acetyl-ADP-ribose deacetylase (regulator of RNase III)